MCRDSFRKHCAAYTDTVSTPSTGLAHEVNRLHFKYTALWAKPGGSQHSDHHINTNLFQVSQVYPWSKRGERRATASRGVRGGGTERATRAQRRTAVGRLAGLHRRAVGETGWRPEPGARGAARTPLGRRSLSPHAACPINLLSACSHIVCRLVDWFLMQFCERQIIHIVEAAFR